MASGETDRQYLPTIGIECHVQLKTKTKLFSAVPNDAREASPNSLISHIDLGMPGALPVLNEKAVELACRMAFAFHTRPQKHSFFERKHYFYPDLPKGYQITQLTQPIIVGGEVEIEVNGKTRRVRLNRVQIEEDAGKSLHPSREDYSLVDLNRAGTPLLEIVSEADLHGAEEAKAYAKELYLLARYTGVSDADLYHGNMRFDVNVSLSKDPKKLGTRTETKNLNSFRSVEKAVEYEIARQTAILEKGQPIVQETRGWDDAKQRTFSQRGKEEAHDYRYFPEPDIPPLELEDDYIAQVEKSVPVLPAEWRRRLNSLGLDQRQIDSLLEAELDDERVGYLGLLERYLSQPQKAIAVANWVVNTEIPLRRSDKTLKPGTQQRRDQQYSAVHSLLVADKLSSTSAKALLSELLRQDILPPDLAAYAEEHGYMQMSDAASLEKIVEQVIADNPRAITDVRNGEMKAIGFLVGQVMKLSGGKANPKLAQELISKKLA